MAGLGWRPNMVRDGKEPSLDEVTRFVAYYRTCGEVEHNIQSFLSYATAYVGYSDPNQAADQLYLSDQNSK